MTDTQGKIRALFLTALMVFSVFAGTIAFSGAAAAAANAPAEIQKVTHYDSPAESDSVIEVSTNNSDIKTDANTHLNVTLDDGDVLNLTNAVTVKSGYLTYEMPDPAVYNNISSVQLINATTGPQEKNINTSVWGDDDGEAITVAPVGVDASDNAGDFKEGFIGTNIAVEMNATGGGLFELAGPGVSRTRGPSDTSRVFVIDTDEFSSGTYNFTERTSGVSNRNVDAELQLSGLGLETSLNATDITTEQEFSVSASTDTVNRDLVVEVLDSDDEVVEGTTTDGTIGSDGSASITVGQELDAGTYTVRVTDTASGVQSTNTINVTEPADVSASFDQDDFTVARGDIGEVTVSITPGETANVSLGSKDKGFLQYVVVTDEDADGEVTFSVNTYTVRDNSSGAINIVADGDDDATDTLTVQSSRNVSDVLDALTYNLEVAAGGSTEDISAFTITQRETQDIRTWTAPASTSTTFTADGANPGVSDVTSALNSGAITQAGSVVDNDLLVHQIRASGIEGLLEDQPGGNATARFFNATGDEAELTIAQTSAQSNRDPVSLQLGFQNTTVIPDPANNTYYVIVDTGEVGDDQIRTTASDYDIDFTLDAGNTSADFLSEDETVNTSVTFTSQEISLTTVNATASDSGTVSGTTNVAPGTEIRVQVQSTEGTTPRFVSTKRVVVQSDGTFSASFDFTDNAAGDEYDVTASGSSDRSGLSTTESGILQAAEETPTDTPTSTATPADNESTATATSTPTMNGTDTPTMNGTDTPTDEPTDTPTDEPTDTPTDEPTDEPTDTPTDEPTDTPTDAPDTDEPTETATESPTTTGTPGFTAVLGVVALLGAALVALRRRN
jgi:surface glycoprotein (TIGR04207 family)/PGF-CTERM protein